MYVQRRRRRKSGWTAGTRPRLHPSQTGVSSSVTVSSQNGSFLDIFPYYFRGICLVASSASRPASWCQLEPDQKREGERKTKEEEREKEETEREGTATGLQLTGARERFIPHSRRQLPYTVTEKSYRRTHTHTQARK